VLISIAVAGDQLALSQNFRPHQRQHGTAAQMGLMVPSGGEGSGLDEIFEYKLPKLNEEERDRYLMGAEIIVFLKLLVYTAPIKDLPRGQIHSKFYKDVRALLLPLLDTIRAAEKTMRKQLKAQLVIWYANREHCQASPEQEARRDQGARAGAADDSDEDQCCQRCRVYTESASDDDDQNSNTDANAGAVQPAADMDCCN
jgi:hypothetical protein